MKKLFFCRFRFHERVFSLFRWKKDSDYIPPGCYLAPLTLFEFLVVRFGGSRVTTALYHTQRSIRDSQAREEGIWSDWVAFRSPLFISCSSPKMESKNIFSSQNGRGWKAFRIFSRAQVCVHGGYFKGRMSYYACVSYKGGCLLLYDGWVPYSGLMRDSFKR
jgi:hypothetical protein